MSRRLIGGISVIAISVILIIGSHSTLLTNPNNFYLGSGIDGFKNYYTLDYHIKYDSSYSHFEGMNYPYGEQVVFTDNQPLISNSLKFISNNIVDISAYTVGILNVLMLLSITLTCLILYLIFQRFKIPDLWAVLFAIGVGFMAPQIHRMGGHYALAYGFIIPLCMLLWMRFHGHSNLRNSMLLGLVVLLSSLIHMYYFAILTFFLSLYMGLAALSNRNLAQLKFTAKHLLVQVIVPYCVIQLWFLATDSVDDRPANPSGFLDYRAHWQGIFLPITYPIGEFIHSIKPIPQLQWEGISYVGLIPGIVFFRYIILALLQFARSRGKEIRAISGNPDLNMLFLISVVILLFSFGIPFIWNLESLVEYLGPLKQFRSIARFSWVFYYGINIVAFIAFYRLIQQNLSAKRTRNITLSIAVLFLLYEAQMFHNRNAFYTLTTTAELEHPNSPSYVKSPLLSMETDKYQAILPLPYFHGGSENVSRKDRGEIGKNTMVASLLTGLPTTAVMMSRTSLSQTLKNMQLVLEPYAAYDIIPEFKSNKPFLLWIEKREIVTEDEQALIDQATIIYEDAEVTLGELPIIGFYNVLNDKFLAARTEAYDSTLHSIAGFLTRDSVLNFYHEYEVNEAGMIEQWITRNTEGNIKDKNVIFNATLPLQDTTMYILSIWVKLNEDQHPTSRIYFDELDKTGTIVFDESWSYGELLKLIDHDWALLEYHFKPHAKENTMRFTITKPTYQDMTVYWNDLLIRPQGNDIYYLRENNIVFKNGRTYGPEYYLKTGESVPQSVN